ncbi:MAG: hypothetical protein ACTSVY_02355 [Candidatus Helarchaeota archaeon]
MTFKYISPKELKAFEKERMSYMKQAEKALKNEDLELVVELFKKIVEVSEKMDDHKIVEEFNQKIRLLTQGTEGSVAEQFEKVQTTIEDFIAELKKAPFKIIKGIVEKIPVDEADIEAASAVQAGESQTQVLERISDYDIADIEHDIKSRGTIQDQLGDLKRILKQKKGEGETLNQ